MRVPIRKAGQYTNLQISADMTQAKYDELANSLNKLKNQAHPQAAAEVKRLAAMGDFSENAAYQMAKGKLRGINQKISEWEKLLSRAKIIKPANNNVVSLGSTVTVMEDREEKTYCLLGSLETDPGRGVISGDSPLGQMLLGKKVGDSFTLTVNDKQKAYYIAKIS